MEYDHDISIEIRHLFIIEKERHPGQPAHSHQGHEWYCVLEGEMELEVEGVRHSLRPAQSFLIAPGVVHSRKGPRRMAVAIFRNRGLQLDDSENRVLTLPPELQGESDALVEELREPRDGDADALRKALLVRLLIGLRRAGERIAPRHSDLVQQVEAYLQANLRWSITREDIAGVTHLSAPHLARLYRAATGKTLGRRLTELRMQRARTMLLESTMPVTRIAQAVGFNSFSHFTRTFRREAGLSPSQVRRRARVV